MQQQFELERTDNRPLAFTGVELASVKSSTNNASYNYSGTPGRWEMLTVFQTTGGKFICYRQHFSNLVGEGDVLEAHVADNPAEVHAFFGWGRLAKELYAAADLDLLPEIVP